MPSGFDPMGVSRFSEKDMRQSINPEPVGVVLKPLAR
jgi:hypothetical protein